MSVEMESLSSILGESASSKGETPAPPAAEPKVDTPAPATTEAKVETKPTPEVKEPVRDEAGRFAPKPEAKAEVKEPLPRADIAAIIDERRKRQDLERQLQEIKSGKPKADFWENPDQAIEERVSAFVSPLQSQNLQLQVEIARLKNPDFDDVMMEFLKAAQKDEVLRHQADNSPNPLEFIYREGKRIKELAPYGGDLSKRDEARFSELKAEIAKKDELLKAKDAELAAVRKSQTELAAVPRSLNSEQSGTPRASDADPDDLKTLVRFK